ncbi:MULTISPECIES: ribulose-phosphate 3-epimerase [Mammaliicoccus]|uniref:Ribulose-phosphate 3-epimerase n=1 Tax=Mammaliicoccus fleurettii TaxID=150056 RepID=A0ABS5MQN7_9STAP|nr:MULTISPECIES: ribulose-phosphate 3-epimerase [Mammaliicoccus]MBL0848243.1 ribulose-phosphate 3-epimerase [Mammaliicoccus fleurettii]MBS3673016.1 ribulose-phosphate 3-epimerase [Mammaliicoccus fleurettii]MBS3698245.1 ribulose-phosphate 3-epimerase [Mammaliicoccus fleurettii]MEB7724190.1 ribulose-phosphate 3-epimerase [Mammaliicoccus fleurettii]
MSKILLPSMMLADFGGLKEEIKALDNADVTGYHIDIMDGQFVPNFGMGLQDLEYIRSATNKPIDVHLMIDNPDKYIEKFADIGVDVIYIHPEADTHPTRTLQAIKDKDKKAGIAINPGTSVESIQPYLSIVDYIMIMTVNPGFAGQKYLDFVDEKIDRLINPEFKNKYNYEILVDGAISPEKVEKLSKKGVKGFVLGSSSLFGKDKSYADIIKELNDL